jgi:hypothetical protein
LLVTTAATSAARPMTASTSATMSIDHIPSPRGWELSCYRG